MSDERGMPILDDEREVDLRSLWRRLAARWWLPLAGLVAGAVLGVLVSVGGGDVFEAKTVLFLGQPFTPNGGGQIQSLATNPKTVSEIVRSEAAIRRAAAAAGLRPGRLRGNVASQAITSPGQVARTLSPLVEITVQATAAAKAERAATSLAESVVAGVSPYVDSKIELLQRQIANDTQQLAGINARIATALQQQKLALENKSLSLAERLLVSTNANNTIGNAELRRGTVQQDLNNASQLLSLAESVERSRVVEPAVAVRTVATSRRNAAAIGGLLGLLAGALAAYLADPLLQRRNEST